MVQQIAEEFAPERIILFGSWAWGDPTPESDVDLLVITETGNSRSLGAQIDGRIFPRQFPLDVMVCRPGQVRARHAMGDAFMTQVLSQGKVLYAI